MTNPMSVNALDSNVARAVVSHINPCISEILQEDRSDITVKPQIIGGSSVTITNNVTPVVDGCDGQA